MMMMSINFLFAIALVGFVRGGPADENVARLVAVKNVLNTYIVEGKEMTLEYHIYNIGASAALDIELKEENFPPSYFRVEHGSTSARWSHLAPGSNLTHSVVLVPLSGGYFNFTSAYLSYRAKESDKEVTFGYTTTPGELPIYPLKEFTRRFSAHLSDWLSFALITTPSLLIPFLLWVMSKRKYEAPALLNKMKTK